MSEEEYKELQRDRVNFLLNKVRQTPDIFQGKRLEIFNPKLVQKWRKQQEEKKKMEEKVTFWEELENLTLE